MSADVGGTSSMMRASNRAAFIVCTLVLVECGFIPTNKTGFFCNDPAISFRFRGDTVSTKLLLVVVFVVPVFVVWFVEGWAEKSSDVHGSECAKKSSAPRGVRLAAIWYREYLLGLAFVVTATQFLKLTVGEPRPHFLFTCKPDAAYNCSGYVEDYNCTNEEVPKWFVRDSTRSFPSGHASLACYTSVFLMWYLQRRLLRWPVLSVTCLQFVWFIWGCVCSLTRITDRRHHWWDVLAGSTFGIFVGVFTVMAFCRGFTELQTSLPTDLLHKEEIVTQENGHMPHAFRNTRHQSVRRLLSSTSSCTGDTATDEQEMKTAA